MRKSLTLGTLALVGVLALAGCNRLSEVSGDTTVSGVEWTDWTEQAGVSEYEFTDAELTSVFVNPASTEFTVTHDASISRRDDAVVVVTPDSAATAFCTPTTAEGYTLVNHHYRVGFSSSNEASDWANWLSDASSGGFENSTYDVSLHEECAYEDADDDEVLFRRYRTASSEAGDRS